MISILTLSALLATTTPSQPDNVTLQIGAARSSPPTTVRLTLPPMPPRLQPVGIEFVPGTPGVNPPGTVDRWRWTFAPVPRATSVVELIVFYVISDDVIAPTPGLPAPYTDRRRWYQPIYLTGGAFTDAGDQRTYTAEMTDLFQFPALRGLDGWGGAIVVWNGTTTPPEWYVE